MSEPHTIVMTRDDHAPWEPDERLSPRPPGQSGPIRTMGGALGSSTVIWLGLAITAAGFIAIFITWVKTAALIDVALQLPYVVSGGLTGLGLVIVGMAVADIAVRRQDSHLRRQQLAQISEMLAELRDDLQTEDREPQGHEA